jgi:hypothetical protein
VPEDLFRDLASNNPDVRINAISDLGVRLDKEEDPAIRDAIYRRVAIFVRSRAAPPPHGGTYRYCTQQPPLIVAPEVLAALQLLGQRKDGDLSLQLDLSNINLAYAPLANLHLDNIIFRGATLCRAILYGSSLAGAYFSQADLRYAIFDHASGLQESQLTDVYSLCGTTVPDNMKSSSPLRRLAATDPEPHLVCMLG